MFNFNKSYLKVLIKKYSEYDQLREDLINNSRKVLKESKKLIFSLHRSAPCSLSQLEDARKKIDEIVKNNIALKFEPSYQIAMQEYVEAMLYYGLIHKKELLDSEELSVDFETYLLGLCDLSGELVRRAVQDHISGKIQEILDLKSFLDEIYAFLLELDPRNGHLRKKIDSVRWSITKIEDLVSQIK